MSKRAAAGRKGKQAGAKDDLARAAAEVLNGITTIGKGIAATAQQALSGGGSQQRGLRADDDATAVDQGATAALAATGAKGGQGAAALTDQQRDAGPSAGPSPNSSPPARAPANAASPALRTSATPGLTSPGGAAPPAPQNLSFHAQAQPQQPTHVGSGAGLADPDGQALAGGGGGGGGGPELQGGGGADRTAEITVADDDAEAAAAAAAEADAAAAEAAAGTTTAAMWVGRIRSGLRRALDSASAAAAARGITTVSPKALQAGAAALVLLLLLLSSSTYRLAGRTHRQQAVLTSDLAALRQEVAAGAAAAAAAAASDKRALRSELAAGAAATAALVARVDGLAEGLAAAQRGVAEVAGEVAALRRALDASDAVQGFPGARTAGTDPSADGGGRGAGATGASAAPAAAEAAPPAAAGNGGAGVEELRGLPACHARRVAAAAGPLLPARVVAHTAVVGDEEPLMRFHSAVSSLFSSSSGPTSSRVHPLARHVTSPATTPVCLPLVGGSSSAVLAGGGGTAPAPYGSVELQLAEPASVAAVSFRYPPYGAWDTAAALLRVTVTLHESDAAASATSTSFPALRTRTVELPPLRGVECQHLALTPAPGATVGAGDQQGASPSASPAPLVHRLTLSVRSTFGEAGYACVPRVLVHGRA
ncbi:hypothetical protein HYH03_000781 [Edaphochlamys debaryana]|uniref:SUN domain-containing protein n=1 Tax=Edaphochlamys debaryana TaxID=47281 RepID=A0A835YDZ7_9CHLO|nr:hypothetical protein HYH03_000781 [Edaphochlamys debaryana]|eukprot:KAG2500958.1 hypothetical protein HYH03_000781 [Edaphochlamys debaryana]